MVQSDHLTVAPKLKLKKKNITLNETGGISVWNVETLI